jgi:hypothetical protein
MLRHVKEEQAITEDIERRGEGYDDRSDSDEKAGESPHREDCGTSLANEPPAPPIDKGSDLQR